MKQSTIIRIICVYLLAMYDVKVSPQAPQGRASPTRTKAENKRESHKILGLPIFYSATGKKSWNQ